jgi:hypothetical protein
MHQNRDNHGWTSICYMRSLCCPVCRTNRDVVQTRASWRNGAIKMLLLKTLLNSFGLTSAAFRLPRITTLR